MSETIKLIWQQDVYKYTVCFHVFSEGWHSFKLFKLLLHCWQKLTRRTTGKLSSTWKAIYLHMYLRASFHHRRRKLLTRFFRIHSLLLHEQVGCIAATELVWTAVIDNGSELIDQLQMVGHLKCIAIQCIKPFGGQKGCSSEPPWIPIPPCAYRPTYSLWSIVVSGEE